MSNIPMKGSMRIILLLIAVFALAACQSPKKLSKTIQQIKFRADPEALEVNGDSVLVTIKGKFPPHAFPKNALVKFQPILHYGDSMEMPLKAQYLKGEKLKGQDGKTMNYKKGGTFTYTDKFEYTPEMKRAKMDLDYNIKLVSKYSDLDQCLAGTTDTTFYGTITTSLTVKPTDDVYSLDKIGDNGGGTRKIIFYYVINEGTLRDSAKKGPAVTEMMKILKDTSFKIATVVMRGYASPDGEAKHNADLTFQRSNSATDVIKMQMKKAGIKQVYDSTFIKQPDNGEDWAGLSRVVSQMDFNGKNEVLGILNDNSLTNDQKEDRLRTTTAWNTTLVNNVLPKLRRTEVIFSGNMPVRTMDQINNIAKNQSRMGELTKRELIMLGNDTKDTATKLAIYKNMMDRWPNDWAGKNNYAAILLKQGKYAEANSMFEDLHTTFPDNDTIASNLGVAKRFMHKYNAAKDLYTDAQQGGVREDNNMGILYIKYGDYASAVNSFESTRCDYNTALAYTLKGDYDQALQKIDCITDKTADDYYLRAIVGARKGDKDLMSTSLTRAVQMNPSIRERAKNDMEFRKYNKSSEFTNSIR